MDSTFGRILYLVFVPHCDHLEAGEAGMLQFKYDPSNPNIKLKELLKFISESKFRFSKTELPSQLLDSLVLLSCLSSVCAGRPFWGLILLQLRPLWVCTELQADLLSGMLCLWEVTSFKDFFERNYFLFKSFTHILDLLKALLWLLENFIVKNKKKTKVLTLH